MLYVTTRDCTDPHTAYKALHNDAAPDGGCYVPFRMEKFSSADIASLRDKTFGQTVADILNFFFSAQLTGWDVESCIGRNTHKLVSLSRKVVISQTWHNPGASYAYIVDNLYRRMCKDTATGARPTQWARIAVRIAVLFGVYGEMLRQQLIEDDDRIDISVYADDFAEPMAAWYAKDMGLPVGTIICGCTESCIWDLIHKGEVNTNQLPDALSVCFERLLLSASGADAVDGFLTKRNSSGLFALEEDVQKQLRSKLFASVIGIPRADTVINSVYRTNGVVITRQTAIAFGCMQDFRAKTGANNITLLFADQNPMNSADEIQGATGLSLETLACLCNKN